MGKTSQSPTSVWRPEKKIKVKVLGLVWEGNSFLACKVYADDGRVIGVRPPGGSVKFGETREHALRREFSEELKVEVESIGDWREYENIFEHEGEIGHEYIFVADVSIASPEKLTGNSFEICEGSGVISLAEWFSLEKIKTEGIEVLPKGLNERMFG